jgi:hypothetical protein
MWADWRRRFCRPFIPTNDRMKRNLSVVVVIAIASGAISVATQSGPLSSRINALQTEILITTLTTTELKTQLETDKGNIEHSSEVGRQGPVAAVVRVPGCQKDKDGVCKVSADIVVYRPDGTVHQEVKTLDLPQGRGALPLVFDGQAPTGVYKLVVTVRDLTTRRFATSERPFGVK